MRKLVRLSAVLAGLAVLAGCETFDRFEAWKMEALFGVPNPYNAQPLYGNPYGPQPPMYAGAPPQGYPQPSPYAAPPGAYYLPGQPVPQGYVAVTPQTAVQPVAQPAQPVQPIVQAVQPQFQPYQPVMQPGQPMYVQAGQPIYLQPGQTMVYQPGQPMVQPGQPMVQPVQPVYQQMVPMVAPAPTQPQALLPPSAI